MNKNIANQQRSIRPRVGSLIRLVNANIDNMHDVMILFLNNNELIRGYQPVNSIGLVLRKHITSQQPPDQHDVYQVLFGDRIGLLTTTYMLPYDPADDLLMKYVCHEGDIPYMETTK